VSLPDASILEVLKDIRANAPDADVIVLTSHGTLDTAIESIRMGAFDYMAKPCPPDVLDVRIRRALESKALRNRVSLLERGLTPPDLGGEFVGQSEAFTQLLGLIDRAAPTDSTVLILGETGSGKKMVARLLHARSRRRTQPFVTVGCAELQDSLLQGELFGDERGAFTGGRARPGLFEVAHGGTLFLDEIADVSLATQAKLLRVLDTSTFTHVGGTAEIRVDVRIMAATNCDLSAMVRRGLFREDLYYRLRTLTVAVPPLRGRGGDVELLATHFVTLFNQRFGVARRLSPDARTLLRVHPWPGNVRELLHAIEAAMVVCDGAELLPEHFPTLARSATNSPGEVEMPTLRALERRHIAQALVASRGRAAAAPPP
jgi:DNA-binding NtrC family response regulator